MRDYKYIYFRESVQNRDTVNVIDKGRDDKAGRGGEGQDEACGRRVTVVLGWKTDR